MTEIAHVYMGDRREIGYIEVDEPGATWERMVAAVVGSGQDFAIRDTRIESSWSAILEVFRTYVPLQRQLDFRFSAGDSATAVALTDFLEQAASVAKAATATALEVDADLSHELATLGFRRTLTDEQERDLAKLAKLSNGANFSVPGAGKTTVAFALITLTQSTTSRVLVVAPKSAFAAWGEVVDDCMSADSNERLRERFTRVGGGRDQVAEALSSEATRFIANYEQVAIHTDLFREFLSRHEVHVILDESHRMKAGSRSQRGAALLSLSTLPFRRDILSGTPMPQSTSDLQSQFDFLWPGHGVGDQIGLATKPRDAVGGLFVRTTKRELQLPPIYRHLHKIPMNRAQSALYSIVRDDTLRQFSSGQTFDLASLMAARGSTVRLLQLASNPGLAIRGTLDGRIDQQLIGEVLSEGPSPKIREAIRLTRALAKNKRKVVIWTIFTGTVLKLADMLADLKPAVVYGGVPSGESTVSGTREAEIVRFHSDDDCWVMIANPAAAGEGISLHHVCHEAVYLDRNYVSTQFLQSIDRIHRLGLESGVMTNVHILQALTPEGVGNIDESVSRRLASKIRGLEELLDDPDLRQLADFEDEDQEWEDQNVDLEDVRDLLLELEGAKIQPSDEKFDDERTVDAIA